MDKEKARKIYELKGWIGDVAYDLYRCNGNGKMSKILEQELEALIKQLEELEAEA